MLYISIHKLTFFSLVFAGILIDQSLIYGQENIDLKEKTVTGLDFGILPSFVYNSDKGLQYGLLANFFYYGDGKIYPEYLYELYLQASRTTKNGYLNYLFFDSKHVLPAKLRLTVEMASIKDEFQHFYGFNGYNSIYNFDYTNTDSREFISKHYYYLKEKSKRFLVDVHGFLPVPNFIWDFGLGYYKFSILQFENPKIPDHTTLYKKYIDSGVISEDQKAGGGVFYYKAGLDYDTRNNESVPEKGVLIEGIFTHAPKAIVNKFSYSILTLKFHHYISISPKIVFAYRLVYQTKINGSIPYYMLPKLMDSYVVCEALGGSETIRGVLTRRIVGNGYALGNFEFRYIPITTFFLKRNFSIGFNLFDDMGLVTRKYNVDETIDGSTIDYQSGQERLHHGVGIGTRLIVNHNFIVALDYGVALDKRDGDRSFYINLGYFF